MNPQADHAVAMRAKAAAAARPCSESVEYSGAPERVSEMASI
jgi:hypothetical protein